MAKSYSYNRLGKPRPEPEELVKVVQISLSQWESVTGMILAESRFSLGLTPDQTENYRQILRHAPFAFEALTALLQAILQDHTRTAEQIYMDGDNAELIHVVTQVLGEVSGNPSPPWPEDDEDDDG